MKIIEHPLDKAFEKIKEHPLQERVPVVDELIVQEAELINVLRSGSKQKLLRPVGNVPDIAEPKTIKPITVLEEQEKFLDLNQQAYLFSELEKRFTSKPEFYQNISWPNLKTALEAADKRLLYTLFQAEENDHKFGVSKVEKAGKKGFRFESWSKNSPKGKRKLSYEQAETIVMEWCGKDLIEKGMAGLMDQAIFDKLRIKLQLNKNSWDYLKTDAATLKKGFALYGVLNGVFKRAAHKGMRCGGFRCWVWVAEV
jgi:hypothetical protein